MQREKRITILGIGVAAVFISAMTVVGVNHYKKEQLEKKELQLGRTQLEKLEKQDVATIEKAIQKMEAEEKKTDEAYKKRPDREKFKDAVVVGDSITLSIQGYHILNKENVVAEIGVAISNTKPLLDKVIGLNKQKVFLAFGMNDLEGTGGDEKKFCKEYKKVLDYLRKGLPEADIYVNSILPIQEHAIRKVKENGKYGVFNQALKQLCKEENVVFLDNTNLVKEEYFEPDGIHMRAAYYKVWLKKMIKVGELS